MKSTIAEDRSGMMREGCTLPQDYAVVDDTGDVVGLCARLAYDDNSSSFGIDVSGSIDSR